MTGALHLQATRRRSRRGFTLVELLLALAASVVIFAAIYGVFSKAIHLRDNANARISDSRLSARAGAVLRNDLRNARVSGGTLAATLTGSVESKHSTFPGTLKFTTTSARDSGLEPKAEVQEVEYYVASDPAHPESKAGRLVRTRDSNLLAPVREAAPEEPLLSGVTGLEVTFFNGQEWLQTWEVTTDSTTLPEAVRVIIRLDAARTPIEVLVPWTTAASIDPAPTTSSATP